MLPEGQTYYIHLLANDFLERNTKGIEERMTATTNNISLVILGLRNIFAYLSMFETMKNKQK